MKQNSWLVSFSKVLISILTTLAILMLSIRVLISPLFARIEYHLPGFPDDPYGFTKEDRLRWSEPSIKYLVNTKDITFLESLIFDNGEAIFNARELSHMKDVKMVVTSMRIALAVFSILLFSLTLIHRKHGRRDMLLRAYHGGGWGIIGLIAAILFLLLLNFNQLFTWFHRIFFTSGTWQFFTSDTLIRLFPMRFWRDAFIAVGCLSLILGVMLVLVTRKKANSG